MWCPYTNREISESDATPEHIIPLSLGGSNALTIRVHHNANSSIGSEIDGALANDPLISFVRREFDARGHSGTKPKVIFKKARFRNRPAQVTFPGEGNAPIIWDAMSKTELPEKEVVGKNVSANLSIQRFARIRFVAKVALSAGYFALGDFYRKHVRHEEVRQIMNAETIDDFKKIASIIKTRIHDQFMPISEDCSELHAVLSFACNRLRGSAAIILPGPSNLGVTVGVLGSYVGTINIPADTSEYPDSNDFDLGHCLLVVDKTLQSMSFRECMANLRTSMP